MTFILTYFRTLFDCFLTLSLGPLSAEGRRKIYRLREGLLNPNGNNGALPQCPLDTLAPFLDFPIELREVVASNGNVAIEELAIIALLAKSRRASLAFEIGTFDGRTSLNISANMGQDGRVCTLDLPRVDRALAKFSVAPNDEQYIDKECSGERFRDSDQAGKIIQLFGDSATFDYRPYLGRCDLIFVDGSHSYEYVRSDSKTALELLRVDGGIVIWHDYGTQWWPDVTLALDEYWRQGGEFAGLRRIPGTSLAILVKEPNKGDELVQTGG